MPSPIGVHDVVMHERTAERSFEWHPLSWAVHLELASKTPGHGQTSSIHRVSEGTASHVGQTHV